MTKEENSKSLNSGTSCRLNPHNKLGRLSVYGICKRIMRVPEKENELAQADVDIKGKNTQESVQFSHSVVSDYLQSHGLQHARPPCPSPTPRACSNSWPSSQ